MAIKPIVVSRLLKNVCESAEELVYFSTRSERNWALKFFVELVNGNGIYEKRRTVKCLIFFKINMPVLEEAEERILYLIMTMTFLPPLMTDSSIRYPKITSAFESTTVQFLDEVAQGHMSWGLFISTVKYQGIINGLIN